MTALAAMTRGWPMLGALGAGLVLAALAAGAGGAPQVVLAGLGVAALCWGVLSLRADRPVAPRSALGLSVAALLTGGAAVGSGAMADVAGLPLAAASVFIASIALSTALAVRARRTEPVRVEEPEPPTARGPRPRHSFVGLILGALLVSALATPALAATEAGEFAVPHGQHGIQDRGHAH